MLGRVQGFAALAMLAILGAPATRCIARAPACGSRGRLRSLRYSNALGSAGECHACLDAARALDYVAGVAPLITEKLDEVIGTLVKVAR